MFPDTWNELVIAFENKFICKLLESEAKMESHTGGNVEMCS